MDNFTVEFQELTSVARRAEASRVSITRMNRAVRVSRKQRGLLGVW
jgi:hypothetical protein